MFIDGSLDTRSPQQFKQDPEKLREDRLSASVAWWRSRDQEGRSQWVVECGGSDARTIPC